MMTRITKYLLIFVILIETLLLGLSVGATYIMHETHKKSEKCMSEILNDQESINRFFNHKVIHENIWIHAESAVTHKYFYCMNRRDDV